MTRKSPAGPEIPSQRLAGVRRRLLAWYDEHHRRLPWRASPGSGAPADAYHVLVSETMLQQTQVATVEPYFTRFIERWPTIADLAAASEQDVLTQWQGLGYYRRARQLHAAARAVAESHGGVIPRDVAQLLELPGVGRYSAGAVASIAFGQSEPIVDGNVARVLARCFAIDEPVDAPAGRDRLWALAARLVPGARRSATRGRANPPGDFNQALMELGALVCTPRRPHCDACPLRSVCAARAAGDVDRLPIKRSRKSPLPVQHHVLAIERRGRHLFQQRPADGLRSHMWQLPTMELTPQAAAPAIGDSADALRRWVRATLGLQCAQMTPVQTFEHRTTHRCIAFHVWSVREVSGRLRRNAGVWRPLSQIDDLPLSNAQQRIVRSLLSGVG